MTELSDNLYRVGLAGSSDSGDPPLVISNHSETLLVRLVDLTLNMLQTYWECSIKKLIIFDSSFSDGVITCENRVPT